MPYYHGIRATEINEGVRAIATVATSVIGLVSIAADADAETFPLDTPVLIDDVTRAIGKAGDGGKLAPTLEAIADQSSPPVIVVRVAEGEEPEQTQTNIIGTTTGDGQLTGMQALLGAESQLGLRPRILGVPGYDDQQVATDLATVAQKLRGMAYTAAQGDTVAEAVTYRENFGAREQMLIWPEFSDFTGSAIARALGLRSKIDTQTGWHKTLSNVAINGVTGLSRPVPFSILGDETTAASLLNDADVTTLARMDGYRFWGNRTCSDEPLFAFESAVRTAQVLQDTIAEGLVWAIDKPIVPGLIRDILESINAKFRDLKTQGRIIDAQARFRTADNSPAAMAAGRLVFDYDYTPCAPAESIGINQRITDRFYAQLLAA
ncbi:phage tail protein [Croceicoccus estronivorus]|uniref:phage tail sheath subtilisin-like domain-containing protein n=1 Tax=Croceicoccus estronivorus TaxID=1172626 RepID=UPI00082C536B|nr:phage tail sheath subtilisin-like domain-containing protein [Croceicoccus estronivorus]OCC25323.1 phage tail protein [Croceicoccus estronivorus]